MATAGGITTYLTLDTTQWDRDIKRARRDVRALRRPSLVAIYAAVLTAMNVGLGTYGLIGR